MSVEITMPKRAPTTQKSNTYQTCSTPLQQPGMVWGHTRDIQKLFQGGTLGVQSTLGESNERGNYNATPTTQKSNTYQTCSTPSQRPGMVWGHTRDIQKLFQGGTLGVRSTLGQSNEHGNYNAKKGPDHTKVKHLSNMLNPLTATRDRFGGTLGTPETILGCYIWGAKYTWGVK